MSTRPDSLFQLSELVDNIDDSNTKLSYTVRGAMSATNGKFRKLFDLTDRVALVTGGSIGFGRVISFGLAEYGCHVAIADLSLENACAVASEVASTGRRALGIAVDVSQPENVKQMVVNAVAEFGTIDILINCAGVSQHDPAELTPLDT